METTKLRPLVPGMPPKPLPTALGANNPFAEKPKVAPANNVIPLQMFDTLPAAEEPKEEISAFEKDFLAELRGFMNEYAETDLNVNSIEEPSAMTKAQANFYVKLYSELMNEETEINELCDAEIERASKAVNLFRQQRQDEINRKKSYFMSILKDFAETELKDKKTKTLKLPYGNLSFKKQQPKFVYGDEDELKSLVKEIKPELIKTETVEKLDKSLLKKNGSVEDGNFYLGGTLIPSVTVQMQEDKFEIK